MSRAIWKVWAICALQICPSFAAADAFSLKQSVKVGKPLRAADVTLGERESLVAEILGSSIVLPARGVHSASIESARVANDAAVTIVRATADNGEWLILLGGHSGKELLLAERSDLHGDPGERRAIALSVEARGSAREQNLDVPPTPEGTGPDPELKVVAVGTRYDGLALCGGSAQPLLVDRRELDPRTLKLVARSGRPSGPANVSHVTPSTATETAPPKLQLLSASSSSVIDPLTATPQVPHPLTDGRGDTSWSAPPGAIAVLRWSPRALPIERFEIELVARKAPATLTFYLDGGSFDVSLPKASAGRDRFSIVPPVVGESGCVALASAATGTLQIAGLLAFTRVDAEGGLERLVSDLVQDGPQSSLSAELLTMLGEPAARSLAARFGELSTRGQRRALKTFANALELPEVQARVMEAARSKDEPLQQAALATLARGQESGAQALRTLAREASPSGDAAARVLAAPDRGEAPALLAALAATGGADRPVLRRALIGLARRSPEPFAAAVPGFLGASPSASARVALALIAAAAERAELGRELAEGALEVSDFADRYRLCLAAGQLAASPKLDSWLAQQATGAEEWMLRRAAYDALLARSPNEARRLSGQIAADAYPRVRAAAPVALAQAGQGAVLVKLAHQDPWPLVRVAAIHSLARLSGSRAVLAQSLEDGSRNVRAASIDGLAAQKASDLWPRIESRLLKDDEWPVVKGAAIQFAATLCIQAARDPLTETARRALHPEANEDDRYLGLVALRALHDLGGQAAADARQLATRETASPQLKMALEHAGPSRCEEKTASAPR